MSSHQHTQSAARGRVDGPALLYGAVGLLVAVAMNWAGLLEKGDQRVLALLHQPVFHGGEADLLRTPVLVGLTALFCIGLAFAVLDSPGTWRRVVLGSTAFVVIAAMVPTMAVWNIYFPPMMTLVGVFWTWFCAVLYASHHRMPCDVSSSVAKAANNPNKAAAQPVKAKEKPAGRAKKSKPANEMDKYKPKD